MGEILVEARDVKKYFPVNRGVIVLKHLGDIKAVDGVSFTIRKGETFGLVGEVVARPQRPGSYCSERQ